MSYTGTAKLDLKKADIGSNQAFETSVMNANWTKIDDEAVAVDGRLDTLETTVGSGGFATLTGTETLTNKTLTAPKIATISNNSNTLTLPTTADTLVGRATTDTLTKKTLAGAVFGTYSFEKATLGGAFLGATLDLSNGSVWYYSSNSTGSSSTLPVLAATGPGVTFDSIMTTGQSMTFSIAINNGTTPSVISGLSSLVTSGSTSGITMKWLGGSAPAGNASSIDVYSFTCLKTGTGAFTVLGSMARYA